MKTLSKAAAGEALTPPVTGKERTSDGVLTLTVDGSALKDFGGWGFYWTSSIYNLYEALYGYFNYESFGIDPYLKLDGQPVRAVAE